MLRCARALGLAPGERDALLMAAGFQPKGTPAGPATPPLFSGEEPAEAESSVFVARERELEQLNTFLGAALGAQGQVVFVGRILIVGIYRPAELAPGVDGQRHPLEPVVNEFRRRFGSNQVDLDQSRGMQFVELFLDTEANQLGTEFRAALYHLTRGNALFTVEMLRGMEERGDLVQDEAGRWVEGPSADT